MFAPPLAGLDLRPRADVALDAAISLARRFKTTIPSLTS